MDLDEGSFPDGFAAGRVVHHVMVRHPDRRAIFVDRSDREDFVASLSTVARDGLAAIYAWALMPNHFHLLVGTMPGTLDRAMRALLDGFRDALRRRGVAGIVPERWESEICRTSRHFVELVRYIHLNPLRGGLVRSVDELDEYLWAGHSALVSTAARDWQATAEVLARFGRSTGWARAAYRKSICDGAVAVSAAADRAERRTKRP